MTEPTNPPQQTPPGWYPTTPGMQGYWDGTQWTGDVAPLVGTPTSQSGSDDTTMALLAHLLGLFTGFLGPLILYLVKKDDSPFVRHHSAEALNFQLTLMIAYVVSFILILVLIGILMLIVVGIAGFVLAIVATVKASGGEWYRYPMTIRFVS